MTISDKLQVLSVWASPYSMRVQLALTAKGLPFTNLPQDLGNKSPLLLQSNPVYKKIPVLLHNDRPVCESLVIVEYIDEAFPSPNEANFLPKDPYDRAVARFWADFVDKKVFNSMLGFSRSSGDARKALVEELKGYIAALEGAHADVAKELPYFGGASVGLVDIILGPAVVLIPVMEILSGVQLLENAPRLTAWMKAFQQSSLVECLPTSEKMAEFVRARSSAQ